jgi:hypothetical protein
MTNSDEYINAVIVVMQNLLFKMQRVTKTAVYKFVLHEAAEKRGTKTGEGPVTANVEEDMPEQRPGKLKSPERRGKVS